MDTDRADIRQTDRQEVQERCKRGARGEPQIIYAPVRKILGIPRKFMDLSEEILGIPRKFHGPVRAKSIRLSEKS